MVKKKKKKGLMNRKIFKKSSQVILKLDDREPEPYRAHQFKEANVNPKFLYGGDKK